MATKRLPMPNVAGYRTFRQVAWAGSFEGQTTVGLGVRARLPVPRLPDRQPRGDRRRPHLVSSTGE